MTSTPSCCSAWDYDSGLTSDSQLPILSELEQIPYRLLSDWRPCMEDLFDVGEELAVFRSDEEARELAAPA